MPSVAFWVADVGQAGAAVKPTAIAVKVRASVGGVTQTIFTGTYSPADDGISELLCQGGGVLATGCEVCARVDPLVPGPRPSGSRSMSR